MEHISAPLGVNNNKRKANIMPGQWWELSIVTHCATTEVGAKEVLTVTECCPLQMEQCFHEVINLDPEVG
jgi:hypothetical protein